MSKVCLMLLPYLEALQKVSKRIIESILHFRFNNKENCFVQEKLVMHLDIWTFCVLLVIPQLTSRSVSLTLISLDLVFVSNWTDCPLSERNEWTESQVSDCGRDARIYRHVSWICAYCTGRRFRWYRWLVRGNFYSRSFLFTTLSILSLTSGFFGLYNNSIRRLWQKQKNLTQAVFNEH